MNLFERFEVLEDPRDIRLMGEKDYGFDNWRNNSYFDESGISRKYITTPNGQKIYNQQKKKIIF